MEKTDILSYVLIFMICIISLKIYSESDYFNLKCVVSEKDGNKYCVRDRENLVGSTDLLALVTERCVKMKDHLNEKYDVETFDEKDSNIKGGIKRLVTKFKPNKIVEILPSSEHTAYSENKGEKLAFCLTETKQGGKLVDINTLTFVALHELAHIMTLSVGHTDEYWKNFKFLLAEGSKIDLYDPIDYKEKPQNYCGMEITDNPLYDY